MKIKIRLTSYLRLSVLTGLVVSTCAADRQSNRMTGEIKFAVLDDEVAIAWNHLAYTHEKNGDYTPMTKPGDYQYTPAFDWVWKPDFSVARPFVLDSVSQFRSPPPPALKSAEYAEASVRSYFTGQPRAVINENEFCFY